MKNNRKHIFVNGPKYTKGRRDRHRLIVGFATFPLLSFCLFGLGYYVLFVDIYYKTREKPIICRNRTYFVWILSTSH
jgi:hypothetical protein